MADNPVLNPTESQYFKTQNRKLRQNYLFGVAQNQLQRQQAGSQYGIAKSDVMRQYRDTRRGYAGDFVANGRLGGGAYQRGLSELAQGRDRTLKRLGTAWDYQLGDFGQTSNQLAQAYYGGAGDIRQQRDALIAQLLAQVK